MISDSLKQLGMKLKNLELHAAHSGRLVLDSLIESIETSTTTNVRELKDEIHNICDFLLEVMPPYAPPLNNMNFILLFLEEAGSNQTKADLVNKIINYVADVTDVNNIHKQITNHLLSVLPNKVSIYTHTLSETFLGVLLRIQDYVEIQEVYVSESRPNYDGWITAKRLAQAGINTQIIIDMAYPDALEHVNVMLTGAEIINPDGSVVAKVGVYPASIYCKLKSIPLYVLVDQNKLIPFKVNKLKMTPISLSDIGLSDFSGNISSSGSYFDVTDSNYITGYVTEKGLLKKNDIVWLTKNMKVSKWLANRLDEMQTQLY